MVIVLILSTSIGTNETVYSICQHMHQQPKSNQPNPGEKHTDSVNSARNITMKRVEANTAPAGIKNRRRQQVIYIHKHGRQENEVDPRPPFFEE